jgi:CRP-like cAMP-binding protein
MAVIQCDLDRCFLCKHCIPEWKELIGIKKKTMQFKKGQSIIMEGEEMKGIYFVYSGVVKVSKHWGPEKELILRFARTGDIFGYRGMTDHFIYPISATAVTSCEACFISIDFLETILQTNISFTYQLFKVYAAELHRAEKRMRDLAHLDVKGRISLALQDLVNLFGLDSDNFISVSISRQDIASYAGTTYETVFKFLTELSQAGILSTSGKSIRIGKPEALYDFIKVQT